MLLTTITVVSSPILFVIIRFREEKVRHSKSPTACSGRFLREDRGSSPARTRAHNSCVNASHTLAQVEANRPWKTIRMFG